MVKKRNSNIELLRILCMVLIVSGHIVGENELLTLPFGVQWCIYRFLSNGGRIAVNCFVIIGAWFLVDMQFDFRRVFRIWFEVFFYNIVITGILILCRQPVGLKRIIQCFIPIFGKGLWFASIYIGLLLLSPFLNHFIKKESQQVLKKFIILLFIGLSVSATLIPAASVFYSDIAWFVFIYLFIGYYKRYVCNDSDNRKYVLYSVIIYLLIFVFACVCKIIATKYVSYSTILFSAGEYYGYYLQTIPSFLCAFFAFLGFKNKPERNSSFINMVSAATFGVYIIHQVPAFYPYLWKWLKIKEKGVQNNGVFYIILCLVGVYVSYTIIDIIRQKIFSKTLDNSNKINVLCSRVTEIFNLE